jgi:protein-tyrosine phosphatase
MKRLLFVCLGNICRSPAAEAVMNDFLKQKALEDKFICDSAGILGYHAGEKADKRMRIHASKRGYDITSISRQFNANVDFEKFDMIIGMDDQNIRDLNQLTQNDKNRAKIFRLTDFCTKYDYDHVPDPYYGGTDGFELVLDLLEDACSGLLKYLKGNS